MQTFPVLTLTFYWKVQPLNNCIMSNKTWNGHHLHSLQSETKYIFLRGWLLFKLTPHEFPSRFKWFSLTGWWCLNCIGISLRCLYSSLQVCFMNWDLLMIEEYILKDERYIQWCCSRRNQQIHWQSGGLGDPGCWTSCMPVCLHHAHVNSRRSTGCVMSLFTTRGQWTESSRMLSKQCFPLCEGRP